jgi:hypothetical protein
MSGLCSGAAHLRVGGIGLKLGRGTAFGSSGISLIT